MPQHADDSTRATRGRVQRLKGTHPEATEHEGSLDGWEMQSLKRIGWQLHYGDDGDGSPSAYVHLDNINSFMGERCAAIVIGDSHGLHVAPLGAVRKVLQAYDKEAAEDTAEALADIGAKVDTGRSHGPSIEASLRFAVELADTAGVDIRGALRALGDAGDLAAAFQAGAVYSTKVARGDDTEGSKAAFRRFTAEIGREDELLIIEREVTNG